MGNACISSLCFILCFMLVRYTPAHGEECRSLEQALSTARQLKLHEDPYWHVLLHYRKGFLGIESLVDDPDFFLAPDGKTSPEAELDATIRAFFDPAAEEKSSAVCLFAARYEWISERLNLDPGALPVPECRSIKDFLERARPEAVTLVFPMAHLNSPASMYGHTLLTIEIANKSSLLAYSVSYSATTRETFGPSFAVKSIVGLYPGYFSVLPYYAKLQEYSDVDHRDIWEYPLNLTEPEIRSMMLHIHELDSIASDYYFFDENCSYMLFFLLEAARPGVMLSERVHRWLIPLDSIRMIHDQGMIAGVTYRPSRTTKIRHLSSRLSVQEQESALALAGRGTRGGSPKVPEGSQQGQRQLYDLSGEYLQYLYSRGEVSEDIYQGRLLDILQGRSRLGLSQDDPDDQIPVPVQPLNGHHSNRFALGAGFKRSEVFQEVRIRPAYHHLMDNDDGYIRGAQLIFADIAVRFYSSDRKGVLESLDVIDITSLTPRDRFFHPVSWKVKTGFIRKPGEKDEDRLVYQINPGGGLAFQSEHAGLVYVMAETDLSIGGVYENDYTIGAGGSAGVIRAVGDFWKAHGYVRDLCYGPWNGFNAFEAVLQNNLTLGPDQSISLDVARRKVYSFYHTEVKFLWNLFF